MVIIQIGRCMHPAGRAPTGLSAIRFSHVVTPRCKPSGTYTCLGAGVCAKVCTHLPLNISRLNRAGTPYWLSRVAGQGLPTRRWALLASGPCYRPRLTMALHSLLARRLAGIRMHFERPDAPPALVPRHRHIYQLTAHLGHPPPRRHH